MSGAARKAEYAVLVRNAAAGDGEAMERLLVRAQEAAYRFSLLVCGHPQDAEDVMQDALLKTYEHVRDISDPEAFRTWLYATVRNACLMKRRRHVGEPASFVPLDAPAGERGGGRAIEVPDATRPADQQVMDEWLGSRLRAALRALPPAQRMVVVMREIEGLSTREVAAMMGISEANVKTRLHRAHLVLQRELQHR